MVRNSALAVAVVACTTASCTAFMGTPVNRVSMGSGSAVTMSMKGAGKSQSSFRSAAWAFITKALFSKPGSNNGKNLGSNGDGGMIGGGNGNGDGGMGQGSFFQDGDGDMDNLLMLGVLGSIGSAASDVWDSYNTALGEKPILVKACTSLVGFSVGDYMAQKYMSNDAFSYERLARMAAFGFLFHGTISHFFYNALDEVIPGKSTLTVIKKVAIDQVLWAPIFTLIFFTWIGVTSGSTPSEIGTKIKNDLVKGVVGSWTVWPIAHAINFRFVPTEQRLLYINTIQIFYNVFLSIIGSK